MAPRVSVVLCAWNPRENWLREAVASALEQQDCEVELIVVDDGSQAPVAETLSDLTDANLRFV